MSAVTIYCCHHRANEEFTGRQAEDLINGLIAQWGDDLCDPQGDHDELSSTFIYQQCPTELMRSFRDGEMYYEHLESMRDSRVLCAESAVSS